MIYPNALSIFLNLHKYEENPQHCIKLLALPYKCIAAINLCYREDDYIGLDRLCTLEILINDNNILI